MTCSRGLKPVASCSVSIRVSRRAGLGGAVTHARGTRRLGPEPYCHRRAGPCRTLAAVLGALILDCDGVIVDTEQAWDESNRIFLERRGATYGRSVHNPM